jgi:Zn-finger nucleic acid-binding protein
MFMLCPTCHTNTLESAHLAPELPTESCTVCHGHWITSARYFSFAAVVQGSPVDPAPPGAGARLAGEAPGLKLCPACRKFMHYYPVGHGLAFGIDKCNTCGGAWLNAGEWEALVCAKLHMQLHAISSDVWQAEVQRQLRAAQEEAAMEKRLGHDEYARLVQTFLWLHAHPHRAEILAYLQHPEEPR